MNVGISIWSTDPLVWSEISDGCKPLVLFRAEGFCVISNISLSLELILSSYHVRSGLINSRLHDWLFRNTFLWKMLRHGGVSEMWSWATHFLSPEPNLMGKHILREMKTCKKLGETMSLQWKYQLYDFLLNTFRLEGRGDGTASSRMTAGSSDAAESRSRESQWLRVRMKTRDHWKESLTTVRKAAGVTTSHHCAGNEIKPCRIPIKVSFCLKKKISAWALSQNRNVVVCITTSRPCSPRRFKRLQ